MGKPMGRHPITHYKNPREPLVGSTKPAKQVRSMRSQLRLGAPSSITASKSKKWSNLTKISSKLGRGPTDAPYESTSSRQGTTQRSKDPKDEMVNDEAMLIGDKFVVEYGGGRGKIPISKGYLNIPASTFI
jgi:hypothetical protein